MRGLVMDKARKENEPAKHPAAHLGEHVGCGVEAMMKYNEQLAKAGGLQAAIAACHARAMTNDQTDSPRFAVLYQ